MNPTTVVMEARSEDERKKENFGPLKHGASCLADS
jgi:hypothetical protein